MAQPSIEQELRQTGNRSPELTASNKNWTVVKKKK